MKAKLKLLLVLLCVVFSTSCSNEDANFDEPTDALTYDDVIQKFLDAGFQLNVPRDSSATVIELHSPQEALAFLDKYLAEIELNNSQSRFSVLASEKIEKENQSNGTYLCSFKYKGLEVRFTITKDCKIDDTKAFEINYFDESYKFEKMRVLDDVDPIIDIVFVKEIVTIVNGVKMTSTKERWFRILLALSDGWALILGDEMR